jgi:hypothetical protein
MGTPTEDFFEDINRRGHNQLLKGVRGTLRFDLSRDEHVESWLVTIRDGDLSAVRGSHEADFVGRFPDWLFDQLVKGEANANANWLRGRIVVEGDLRLGRLFDLLFPGPPGARHPRAMAPTEAG